MRFNYFEEELQVKHSHEKVTRDLTELVTGTKVCLLHTTSAPVWTFCG